MIIRTLQTSEITTELAEALSDVAASAFHQPLNEAMKNDTAQHLQSAEHIQVLYTPAEEAVGFALYRSCLWQLCN